MDTIFIPGVRCHPLDPSQSPEYSWNIRDKGIMCKTIFDCTVPYELKDETVADRRYIHQNAETGLELPNLYFFTVIE